MRFKNRDEFLELHKMICPGQVFGGFGGFLFFKSSCLFCKLCDSYYWNGKGQLDSNQVKELLSRVGQDIVDYYRDKNKAVFRNYQVNVEEGHKEEVGPSNSPVSRESLIRWVKMYHAKNVEEFKEALLWRLRDGLFDG